MHQVHLVESSAYYGPLHMLDKREVCTSARDAGPLHIVDHRMIIHTIILRLEVFVATCRSVYSHQKRVNADLHQFQMKGECKSTSAVYCMNSVCANLVLYSQVSQIRTL